MLDCANRKEGKDAMNRHFDTLLAAHCGPMLAGIKPANLILFSVEKAPDYDELLARYNEVFNRKGIYFELLCRCGARGLLFAFRKEKLRAYLSDPRYREILSLVGYPNSEDLAILLDVLKTRMMMRAGFPHEIGVFLGYPPEDIRGFLEKSGRHFLYAGYWKVYEDVDAKKALFHRYDRCREAILKRVDAGLSIAELFAV
jgi:hypothetical protein